MGIPRIRCWICDFGRVSRMTSYLRRPLVDILEVDGEALVLLEDSRVVRLSPIATAILDLTATAREVDDLAAAVEDRFGPPDDGGTTEAVRGVVADLVVAGVLEAASDESPETERDAGRG